MSIKSFPDYKHLLQENYVEYKYFFLPLLKLVSKIFEQDGALPQWGFTCFWMQYFQTGGLGEMVHTLATTIAGYHAP